VPDGTPAGIDQDNGNAGSGTVPGLSPLEALRSARRTLADAEARIKTLTDERNLLGREIATWDATARHAQALIEYYEARMHGKAMTGSPPLPPPTASTGSIPDVRVDRFSKIVTPVANELIELRGSAVPIEDIFAALPVEAQVALQSKGSLEDVLFRIRRTLRRNRRYAVTDEGIAFANMVPPPAVTDRAVITRLLRRRDGSIARIEMLDSTGQVLKLSPREVREALRAGRRILVPGPGDRQSTLRLAGGRFYSEIDSVENDDFFHLPEGNAEAE
jgi:hypothetical protein